MCEDDFDYSETDGECQPVDTFMALSTPSMYMNKGRMLLTGEHEEHAGNDGLVEYSAKTLAECLISEIDSESNGLFPIQRNIMSLHLNAIEQEIIRVRMHYELQWHRMKYEK